MHGYNGGWGVAEWLTMMAIGILFGAGVICLVVAFLRGDWHDRDARPSDPPPPRSADEALSDRFASGQIDDDEYRRRLEMLRSEAGSS